MRLQGASVGPGFVAGMVIDISLCFAALLLAASTLTSRYMSLRTEVPELPLILFGATVFSIVMALMYALFGLYRPKPISAVAASGRTLVALCIGGYLTALWFAGDLGGPGARATRGSPRAAAVGRGQPLDVEVEPP